MPRNIFFIICIGLLLNNATVMGMNRNNSAQEDRAITGRKRKRKDSDNSEQPHKKRKTHPLLDALKNREADKALSLLKEGCDPYFETNYGWGPLHFAAIYGYIEVLTLLLEKGVFDVNTIGMTGATPLNMAIRNGHTECARMLLNSGTKLNKVDLMYYAYTREFINKNPEMRELMEPIMQQAIRESQQAIRESQQAIRQSQQTGWCALL